MGYGYEKFVERLIELAGIRQPIDIHPPVAGRISGIDQTSHPTIRHFKIDTQVYSCCGDRILTWINFLQIISLVL
jgi:hypothetical protein